MFYRTEKILKIRLKLKKVEKYAIKCIINFLYFFNLINLTAHKQHTNKTISESYSNNVQTSNYYILGKLLKKMIF